MAEVHDHVYDAAVRALLKCPDIAEHAHISIEMLRAMVDDPQALRAALSAAIDNWEASDCDRYEEGRSDGYWDGYSVARGEGAIG